jgi:hypothetical protein
MKIFISPLLIKSNFSGYSNLGWYSFLSELEIHHSMLSLLSIEKSVIFMGLALYVTCCFSLVAFNIL